MNRQLFAILAAISLTFALFCANQYDFAIFYKSGLAIRSGLSPYSVEGFYSPLLVAWAMVPVTFLPLEIAYRVNAFIAPLVYALVFWRASNKNLLVTAILMCSSWVWQSTYIGQIDWVVMLGLLLPARLAIWSFVAKPQIGFVALALTLWKIPKWVIPIGAMLALSFMSGWMRSTPMTSLWNFSIWPIGIPLGIAAAVWAFKKKSTTWALLSGPLLSPYVGPSSWVVVSPALALNWPIAVLLVFISWFQSNFVALLH